MKIWDCKYYESIDFWKGGLVGECSKKNVQIPDDCDICEECEEYVKKEIHAGEYECIDICQGVAYHDCCECSEDMKKDCKYIHYFEDKKVKE